VAGSQAGSVTMTVPDLQHLDDGSAEAVELGMVKYLQDCWATVHMNRAELAPENCHPPTQTTTP